MRITKISVKGLFGMFDHEIPLNQDERITIIHGPNGVGKTVLFNMIDALFNFEFQYLKKIPFNQFCIELQEGAVAELKSCLKVIRSDDGNSLSIQYEDMSEAKYAVFRPLDVEPEQLDRTIRDALPQHSKLHREGKTYWARDEHYQFLVTSDKPYLPADFDNMTAIFGKNVELFSMLFGRDALWFLRICEEILVDSISSQRILHRASVEDISDWIDEDMPAGRAIAFLDMIEEHFNTSFGEELHNEYGERSLEHEAFTFWQIINDNFLFKSVKLEEMDDSRYMKFVFRAHDGAEIPYSELSSGEQNLLYLYFRLIFWHGYFGIRPEYPKIVMIDEPELSMNVVWQRNFLKDLQRIIELRKFDVLIATHSPEVIYDKWDWVVHLGETVDD